LEQWNAFVELLPLWLAPNMVTLLGFMCIIFNVGLLIVMMPDLEGPVRAFRAPLSQLPAPS
jgi:ethanolaminephosphotransferase